MSEELVCENCHRTFSNPGGFKYHTNNCDEGSYDERDVQEMLAPYDSTDERLIYVLRLRRVDGEVFYYVGSTNDLELRLRHHMKYDKISMPTVGGDSFETGVEFVVDDVEEIEYVDDTNRANVREREKKYEVCLDKETTNILGGDGRKHV